MSMVVGSIPYVLVVATNLKPNPYYSLPAYALLGAGAAVLWTGEGVRGCRPSLQLPSARA